MPQGARPTMPPPDARPSRNTARFSRPRASPRSAGSDYDPFASARPPPKACPPTPPQSGAPKPDWLQPRVPPGARYVPRTGVDHTGGQAKTSLLYSADLTMMLPTTLMGPLAGSVTISVWAQYLRRLTTYTCMNFVNVGKLTFLNAVGRSRVATSVPSHREKS